MNTMHCAERRLNERRQEVELLGSGKTTPPDIDPIVKSRRRGERRVGERRKENLGPPSGIDERRFRPDLRGVVFPLFYNFK
ncbi:MAG: hypothetical protein H6R16_1226 [Proteobacteria bacterium]|nr:hypothetical protein [Pseudomonadota bacterium]